VLIGDHADLTASCFLYRVGNTFRQIAQGRWTVSGKITARLPRLYTPARESVSLYANREQWPIWRWRCKKMTSFDLRSTCWWSSRRRSRCRDRARMFSHSALLPTPWSRVSGQPRTIMPAWRNMVYKRIYLKIC